MKSGIYKIENLVNSKLYIGYATDTQARKRTHFHHLRKGTHKNCHLQNAWNEYGEENFKFEELEMCETKQLIEKEDCWAKLLKVHNREYGYNLNETGEGEYNKPSKESIEKRVATRKANGSTMSEEGRKRIGLRAKENDYWFNKKFTEEHRKNLSSAHKGHVPTEKTRKIISAQMMGNKYACVKRTDEFKKHLSELNKGKVLTEEHKKKISEAHKRRKNDKTRNNTSDGTES